MNYDFIFLGSKQFGLDVFQAAFESSPQSSWLVICPEDDADLRGVGQGFIDFCQNSSIDIKIVSSRAESEQILTQTSATAALVCGWYWLIPEKILNKFENGIWGIHNSLLPTYRGGSPLVWALINGEEIVGSSLFELTSGMDTGDIVEQVEERVLHEDNISTVGLRLQYKMINLIKDQWKLIAIGKHSKYKQEEKLATYCGQRIAQDGEIDWTNDARSVRNFIRAQCSPYPGAFTTLNSQKIFIEHCEIFEKPYFGTPGQILSLDKYQVTISCGFATAIIINRTDLRTESQIELKLTFNSRLGQNA